MITLAERREPFRTVETGREDRKGQVNHPPWETPLRTNKIYVVLPRRAGTRYTFPAGNSTAVSAYPYTHPVSNPTAFA